MYIKYLEFVRVLGVKQRRLHGSIKTDLKRQLRSMQEEQKFLPTGLAKAKESYESKKKLLKVSDECLFALAWEVKGFPQ